MRRNILILILAIILGIATGCGNTIDSFFQLNNNEEITNKLKKPSKSIRELSMEEKIKDFESMFTIIKENYPYLEVNKRMNGVDWLSNKEAYLEKIKKTNNDEEFFNTLQDILRDLNNGHTHIVSKDFYGLIKEVYNDMPSRKPWADELNKDKAQARYGEVEVKREEDSGNHSKDYYIENNVISDIYEKENVAYLRIDSFSSMNIDKDSKNIRKFLGKIDDCKALIIDIRGNSGGSTNYWGRHIVPLLIDKPLTWSTYSLYRGEHSKSLLNNIKDFDFEETFEHIDKIKEEKLPNLPPEVLNDFDFFSKSQYTIKPKNTVKFKGQIYLLVSEKVYSASEGFASFSKATGFATLVGERTGGDGIGIDPALYTLPNSGFVLRYSIDMGLASDGTCNEEFKTEPDISVFAQRTLMRSTDKAIQKVLELEQ